MEQAKRGGSTATNGFIRLCLSHAADPGTTSLLPISLFLHSCHTCAALPPCGILFNSRPATLDSAAPHQKDKTAFNKLLAPLLDKQFRNANKEAATTRPNQREAAEASHQKKKKKYIYKEKKKEKLLL